MDAIFRYLKSPRGRRSLLLGILWLAMGLLLVSVREVLLPFFIAIFLAYVLEPPISWIAGRKIGTRQVGRGLGVVAIYVGVLAILWLFAVFLIPRVAGETVRLTSWVAEEVSRADQTLDNLAGRSQSLADRWGIPVKVTNSGATSAKELPPIDAVAGHAPLTAEDDVAPVVAIEDAFVIDLAIVAKDALSQGQGLLDPRTGVKLATRIQSLVSKLFGGIFQFFLVLMLTAFILIDTDRIKRFFFTIVPIEDRHHFDELLGRMDNGLSGVVRGQLTICVVNGVLTLIGLLLFQVKYAFVLAVIAAVFSLIPIFGSILSTLPIVIVAFVNSGPMTAVGMLVWIVGIHLLEANLLNPKILGDSAKIHPVLVVLALVVGEHFYGIAGALFAVPITSIALTLFRYVHAQAGKIESEGGAQRTPAWRRRPKPPLKVRVWKS